MPAVSCDLQVRQDVLSTLRMRAPVQFQVSFYRSNLHFRIIQVGKELAWQRAYLARSLLLERQACLVCDGFWSNSLSSCLVA